jgi:hypothetical protein
MEQPPGSQRRFPCPRRPLLRVLPAVTISVQRTLPSLTLPKQGRALLARNAYVFERDSHFADGGGTATIGKIDLFHLEILGYAPSPLADMRPSVMRRAAIDRVLQHRDRRRARRGKGGDRSGLAGAVVRDCDTRRCPQQG